MSNTPIDIEFREEGVDDLLDGFDELISALKLMNQFESARIRLARDATAAVTREAGAYNKLADAMNRANAAAKGGSGQLPVSSGSSAQSQIAAINGGSTLARSRASRGPSARYLNALQQYNDATNGIGSMNTFDAAHHLRLASNAYHKAQLASTKAPPSPAQRMHNMLMSSRAAIGPNGQIQLMPLVHQLKSATGISSFGGMLNFTGKTASPMAGVAAGVGSAASATGPLGVAVAAAGAVLGSVIAVISVAVERLHSFSNALHIANGTMRETVVGMRAGRALGLDFGARALQFGESLNGGGISAAYARRAGINPVGNLLGQGDQDFAGKMLRALKALLNEKSDQRAFVMARAWGMTDTLWARDASAGVKKQLFENQESNYSPAARQQAADMQIRLNLAMNDFMEVIRELGVELLPTVTASLKMLADGISGIVQSIKALINPSGAVADAVNREMDKARRDRTVREHTDAMNRHTQALNNGIYGGGDRARRALPGGWGPQQHADAAAGVNIGLGAI